MVCYISKGFIGYGKERDKGGIDVTSRHTDGHDGLNLLAVVVVVVMLDDA